LFSFGLVLYEMATGRAAFSGPTAAAIFDAILNREPAPPLEINPQLPPKLEEIINKAIEKDRDLRCQSAAELRADLKRLKRDTDSGRSAGVPPAVAGAARPSRAQEGRGQDAQVTAGETPALHGTHTPRRRWLQALAALGAAVVAAAIFLLLRTPPAPKVLGQVEQITHTGRQKAGRLATDGARVYFTEIVGGQLTPMLVPAAGGEPVETIPMPLKNAVVQDITPDGSELNVGVATPDMHFTVWKVPILGGSARRVGGLVGDYHFQARGGALDTPDGRGRLPILTRPKLNMAYFSGTPRG
jgi:eukaryotic-like serine/threonine-protein kinase